MEADLTADWVTATFTAVSAIATVVLVVVAIVQLGGLKEQLKQSAEQERRRNTLEVVQRSESDKFIHAAYKEVQTKVAGSTDYSGTTACEDHIVTILNYFEGLAIGIAQNIYVEKMARDYLQEALKKAVDIWLIGELPGHKVPEKMFGLNEYTELRRLYGRWFPAPEPAYKAG
jgi:hypothetical protein